MHIEALETSRYTVYPIRTESAYSINYCYLLVDKATRQGALVDPSWEVDTILQRLNGLGVELTSILLTHSHFDHTNLAAAMVQRHRSAQVYMSRVEIEMYAFHCRNLHPLTDGDPIQVGETLLSSILTPGHTAGSMCFYTEGVMFTGDTIFTEGCGKCSPWGGSASQMYDSVQRIKAYPAETVIYPGHSFGAPPGQTLDYLQQNNIYFVIQTKDTFVQFRMREKQPAAMVFY